MKTIEGLSKEMKNAMKAPLESIQGGAVTVRELRQIDRICKAIEETEGALQLEDTDYNFLKQRWLSFNGWNPAARTLILQVGDKLGIE